MADGILQDTLRSLAYARERQNDLNAAYLGVLKEFEHVNAQLIADRKAQGEVVALLETQARGIALSTFGLTGDKKPADGVQIKEKVTLQYDPAVALEHAKQTKLALLPESLDVKAFEKIAKASPASFPFVTVITEPQAQIASDLSALLPPAVEEPVP